MGLRADQAGVAAVVRAGSRPLSPCSLARRRPASGCFALSRRGAGIRHSHAAPRAVPGGEGRYRGVAAELPPRPHRRAAHPRPRRQHRLQHCPLLIGQIATPHTKIISARGHTRISYPVELSVADIGCKGSPLMLVEHQDRTSCTALGVTNTDPRADVSDLHATAAVCACRARTPNCEAEVWFRHLLIPHPIERFPHYDQTARSPWAQARLSMGGEDAW